MFKSTSMTASSCTPSSLSIVKALFVALSLVSLLSRAGASAPWWDSEKSPTLPMPPAKAAAGVTIPKGFHTTVFAAEPDVRQPIAMTTDPRGRLWVAENYSYSERTIGFHPELRDRIVILEDTDNDGHFDKRTVFWDGAHRLTSIEVGLGGVWALTLPNLVFIPDRNGDDVPDSDPVVILEGFEHIRARHNVANGLRWGPDGWLYGRHGILGTSKLRPPGGSSKDEVAMNVGVWRFHPQRGTVEVVARGTTNPWGMDWDAYGEPFFINTVIGHLWHLIPGANYRRMFGDAPNPRLYELIDQHADHVHWATGEAWLDVRKGASSGTLAAGGGHAHVGLLIYQGGQWPDSWNGKLLTLNFHGRRVNVERLEQNGSGFIGRGEPDAFYFPDPWFRPIDIIAAPDGGVFISDWSDTGECHENDGVSRSSGRVFKVNYGESAPRRRGDLRALSLSELANLQLEKNDWLARQARRVLADRAQSGDDVQEAISTLSSIQRNSTETVHRLRALWALHVMEKSSASLLNQLLDDKDAHVRTWAVRLLVDLHARDVESIATLARNRFPVMAARESSAAVRLTLASTLQQIPVEDRFDLASALLGHAQDSGDHNIPLMIWYGIQPAADLENPRFELLLANAKIPRVQRLGARRLAEDIDHAPNRLDRLLTSLIKTGEAVNRHAVIEGVLAGLAGRRQAPPLPSWREVSEGFIAGGEENLIRKVRELNALFGDGRALDEIRAKALDENLDIPQRRAALHALTTARAPDLRAVCERLLRERELSATAASGLSLFDDNEVAEVLIHEWPRLYGHERPPVMNVLVARPSWAMAVLEAISAGVIARNDVSISQARRIRAFKSPKLSALLTKVWGEITDLSSGEQAKLLASWKERLTETALAEANLQLGRQSFRMLCAGCHVLNGEGGNIGPDLTGSNRDNLDYLLENILFPSAVLADEHRQTTLTMKDGRVLAGVVASRAGRSMILQTAAETTTVDANDVLREERSTLSLMPEGLLDSIDQTAARDLIAYLMSK